jgi:hypothetical protein
MVLLCICDKSSVSVSASDSQSQSLSQSVESETLTWLDTSRCSPESCIASTPIQTRLRRGRRVRVQVLYPNQTTTATAHVKPLLPLLIWYKDSIIPFHSDSLSEQQQQQQQQQQLLESESDSVSDSQSLPIDALALDIARAGYIVAVIPRRQTHSRTSSSAAGSGSGTSTSTSSGSARAHSAYSDSVTNDDVWDLVRDGLLTVFNMMEYINSTSSSSSPLYQMIGTNVGVFGYDGTASTAIVTALSSTQQRFAEYYPIPSTVNITTVATIGLRQDFPAIQNLLRQNEIGMDMIQQQRIPPYIMSLTGSLDCAFPHEQHGLPIIHTAQRSLECPTSVNILESRSCTMTSASKLKDCPTSEFQCDPASITMDNSVEDEQVAYALLLNITTHWFHGWMRPLQPAGNVYTTIAMLDHWKQQQKIDYSTSCSLL